MKIKRGKKRYDNKLRVLELELELKELQKTIAMKEQNEALAAAGMVMFDNDSEDSDSIKDPLPYKTTESSKSLSFFFLTMSNSLLEDSVGWKGKGSFVESESSESLLNMTIPAAAIASFCSFLSIVFCNSFSSSSSSKILSLLS